MEVILKNDILGLGGEGEIRKVADGYARNYLLPQGLALPKTAGNLKWLERQQKVIVKRREEKSFAAKTLADKIATVCVELRGKISSGNKLYGAIHAQQISESLKEQGIEIDARRIEITDPIKTVGEFTVVVKLYEGIHADLKIKVTGEDGEMPVEPVYKPAAPVAAPVATADADAADETPTATAETAGTVAAEAAPATDEAADDAADDQTAEPTA
jgi:large subunit ribosomal protein L9